MENTKYSLYLPFRLEPKDPLINSLIERLLNCKKYLAIVI